MVSCSTSLSPRWESEDETANAVFPLSQTKFTVVPVRQRAVFLWGTKLSKNVLFQYIANTIGSIIKIWQRRDCNQSREPPVEHGKHDSCAARRSFPHYLWVPDVFQGDDDSGGEAGTFLSRKPADGKMKSFHPDAWPVSRYPCKAVTRGFPNIPLWLGRGPLSDMENALLPGWHLN